MSLLLLWLATGCSGDNKSTTEKTTSRKKTSDSASISSSSVPVSISRVNVYLETSASMAGYLSGATEFKDELAALVSQLDKFQTQGFIANTGYFIIPRDTAVQKLADAGAFLNLLKSPKSAIGANSLIVDILNMLQARNNAETINIFVSDFILSDIDINNKSIVQGQVSRIFNRYQSAGTATSIYAFISEFNGKYYPYPKGVQEYSKVERPFYIWIFGNSQKVDALNQALKKNGFSPEEELHFGFDFNASPTFRVMNYAGKQGSYVVTRNNLGLENVELYKGRNLEIGLGMDLSAFPDKITASRYLTTNLQFEGKNVEGEIVSVQPINKVQLQKSDNLLAENNKLTHLVTVQISAIRGKQGSFSLTLAKHDTPWFEEWNTDDDSKAEKNEGKTFALAYLIGGVRQAYKDNADYFTINVPVVKE
jgi:hypothetical protein